MPEIPPVSDPPYGKSWLVLADTHEGQSFLEHVRTVLDLARADCDNEIEGLIHLGDGNLGFGGWWFDPECGGASPNDQILFTPGNHDTDTLPGEPPPSDPYSLMRATYSCFEAGTEWYVTGVGGVSIFTLSNCTDCLDGNGASNYNNCNPPGLMNECNPDHSGITDPQSDQRQWLATQLALAQGVPWKVAAMHRPAWAPFSSDKRPIHTAMRAILAGCGFSLALGGDIHIGSFSGPFEDGIYSLTLAGGFFVRSVDDEALPPEMVHWASGGAHGSGLTHCALLTFGEETCLVRVFEASDANPTGGKVFEMTIPRNAG